MFSGSLVALVTPMYATGEVDYQALDRLLAFHLAAGTDGLVILGSTGEGSVLTLAEREQLVRHTIDYIDGRLPVIVGVGSNSTQMTLEAAQRMSNLGASALLVICPYYNKPTQEGIYLHFAALNDQVACPIIVYNHPGRTGSDILPSTMARLAKLPNIIGLKESVTDLMRFKALQALASEDFVLLSGDDPTCLDLMRHGGSGVISVVANIIPDRMQAIIQAALKKDWDLAANLLRANQELIDMTLLESNPIPVKWAVAQMNLIDMGIRLPLTLLTPSNQTKMLAVLRAAGLVAKE